MIQNKLRKDVVIKRKLSRVKTEEMGRIVEPPDEMKCHIRPKQ